MQIQIKFSSLIWDVCCTGQNKPATSYEKITINKNSRATLSSLRHIISKNKYRKDLRMVSVLHGSNLYFKALANIIWSLPCFSRLPCDVPVLFWRARSLLWSKRSAPELPRQHKMNYMINKVFMFWEKQRCPQFCSFVFGLYDYTEYNRHCDTLVLYLV